MIPKERTVAVTRTAVMHNGSAFDEIALARFGVRFDKKEDTLIAHHAFASHMPQGLGHVASVFADVGPWKSNHQAGGALAERGSSPWDTGGDELCRYNAADVRIDACLWHEMQPDLQAERHVYERDMAMAGLCQEMQVTGLLVDQPRRAELSRQLQRRAAALLGEIRKLARDPSFDPAKPADLRRALFGRMRAPYFKLTASGYRSTAKEVLEALRSSETPYGRLADLTLRWRSAMKSDATFLRSPLGLDGRVHASWRAFGTATGRPACVAAGTLVEVVRDVGAFPKGIPIEQVKVGDLAYCYVDGKPALRKVLASWKTGQRAVVRVYWRGQGRKHTGYVDLTSEHLVLKTSGEWVRADELKPFDRVMAMSRDVNRGGYARLYFTGVPGSVRDHRFVFNQLTGQWPEHVHHENEQPLDNRFDNLRGMTNSEHQKLHGAHVSEETREKKRRSAKARYDAGLSALRPMHKEEHPLWLGFTREQLEEILKLHNWSVTKACRALGHDFNSFKGHVVRVGFDLADLKRRNRALRHDQIVEGMRRAQSIGAEQKRSKRPPNNHEVLRVEKLVGKVDVYDLTVEESENFIVNELCVHNCRNPNLLNLPRFALVECVTCGATNKKPTPKCRVCGGKTRPAWESQIRDVYYCPPGYVWVYYDLKTAEMYASAFLSQDPAFVRAVLTGDIHTENAKIVFGDDADILRVLESDPKGAGERFRSMAKTAGFAVNYGAAAVTVWKNMLSNGFSVRLSDVEHMLDLMRSTYRVYYDWVGRNAEEVARCGFMTTALLGRKRWFGCHAKLEELMSNPIQSLVSDIMGERLLETHSRKPRSARLVKYAYDAAIYEVREKDAESLRELVKDVWSRPVAIEDRDGRREWKQPIDMKTVMRESEL